MADALETQDAAWHDIKDGHLKTIEELQAQVAVMAGVLAEWVDVYERMFGIGQYAKGPPTAGTLHEHAVWRKAKTALSAAPKVVYSGIGMVGGLTTPNGPTLIRLDCIGALGLGRRYNVLVLALEQDEESKQEDESCGT